jgi:hypothetical protein
MKQSIGFTIILIIILFTNCKKDDLSSRTYLTLTSGKSAYETYESLQELYERQTVTDLFVEDSFSSIVAARHFIPLYYDFILKDSVHPDTINEFKFHFEDDTLNSIQLLPELSSVTQWPTYQVSSTIIFPGVDLDDIFEELNSVNQIDTFERIINIYLDYKNLDKRFSNNMYEVDSWFATEINKNSEQYTIELTFEKGVLSNIERYQE